MGLGKLPCRTVSCAELTSSRCCLVKGRGVIRKTNDTHTEQDLHNQVWVSIRNVRRVKQAVSLG